MANSNTKRSLDAMRSLGGVCQVVEHRVPVVNILRDLYGCIDILCMMGQTLTGVQACSRVDHNKRLQKSLDEPRLKLWLAIPSNTFEVHSWAKQGPRGKAKRWNVRIQQVTLLANGSLFAEAPYTPGQDGIPAFPTKGEQAALAQAAEEQGGGSNEEDEPDMMSAEDESCHLARGAKREDDGTLL